MNLSEYYIIDKNIKKSNLWAFWQKFLKIIFDKYANEDVTKLLILLERLKAELPSNKFDDYNWKSFILTLYFFYNYPKTIIIIKNKDKKDNNIFFIINYSNWIL